MNRIVKIGMGALLLGVAAVGSGCTTTAVLEPVGHSHEDDDLAERCAGTDVEKDPELAETCRRLRATYYRDLRDGGNDIFKPGCHRVYDNPQCRGRGRLFAASGDLCQSRTRIAEWTDAACHPARPVDSSKFDCEKECQKQGATTGVCVTDDDFCADGIDSAHCECITT